MSITTWYISQKWWPVYRGTMISRYFVKKLITSGWGFRQLSRPIGSKGAPFSLFDCVKLTRRSPATPIIYLPLSHSHSIFPHPNQKSLAYQLPTPLPLPRLVLSPGSLQLYRISIIYYSTPASPPSLFSASGCLSCLLTLIKFISSYRASQRARMHPIHNNFFSIGFNVNFE